MPGHDLAIDPAAVALRASSSERQPSGSPDDRYARQELLPGWCQDRLARARVVVMGVGALGNEAAQCLALAGVGSLVLCDPDTIEASNLSRTPLFRAGDVDRFKVEAAADSLRATRPDLEIEVRRAPLKEGVGLGELADASLVLGCLDSLAARMQLAGRCGLVGAPWIDGGTGRWGGEVRPYLEVDGPCYGCGKPPADRAVNDNPLSCEIELPVGAAAPISAIVGAQMSLAAVRFLMGLSVEPGILAINAESGVAHLVALARDATCPFHDRLPEARNIEVRAQDTVGQLLAAVDKTDVPLSWNPIVLTQRCGDCGQVLDEPTVLRARACSACGGHLQPRTTEELTLVSRGTPLSQIGVPPQEILAVRSDSGIHYVRLAG